MHSEADASFFYVSCKVAGCVFLYGLILFKGSRRFFKTPRRLSENPSTFLKNVEGFNFNGVCFFT